MTQPSDPGARWIEQVQRRMQRMIDSTNARIAETETVIKAANQLTRRDSPSPPPLPDLNRDPAG